jgi:lipoprotein-anchoring transpeptidase ErfK/SrfK
MHWKLKVSAAAVAVLALLALAPISAHAKGTIVATKENYSSGTIVVHTNQRQLLLFIGNGQAISYPVGVGRDGKRWSGTTTIEAKYVKPAWSPPSVVRHDHPNLPNVIAGGSPRNPMGVAAMSLAGGEYAIHGTNQPGSIGHFVSYGCIRMFNADITDLYGRVGVGTTVVVR